MKAVRPESIIRGTFVDNHCIKHENHLLFLFQNDIYSLFSLIFGTQFKCCNFKVMDISLAISLFHLTDASIWLHPSFLCKWRYCLKTSILLNVNKNIKWRIKSCSSFDEILWNIKNRLFTYLCYFYFILW